VFSVTRGNPATLRNFASPDNPAQRAAGLFTASGSNAAASAAVCNRKLHLIEPACNLPRINSKFSFGLYRRLAPSAITRPREPASGGREGWRLAPARVRARGKRDQEQVVEIPRFRVRKTGNNRVSRQPFSRIATQAIVRATVASVPVRAKLIRHLCLLIPAATVFRVAIGRSLQYEFVISMMIIINKIVIKVFRSKLR